MSTPSTMSLLRLHRPMGGPPTHRHLAIQIPPPPRSTPSTTHRLQGRQPCECPAHTLLLPSPPVPSLLNKVPSLLCLQVQHRPVLPLCCPLPSRLLPAQPQSPELPPGGAKPSRLPKHSFTSQLPPHALAHGLSGTGQLGCPAEQWPRMGCGLWEWPGLVTIPMSLSSVPL